MNKRKILGTIIGLIFWSFCVVFFTYAYYDWKSVATNVVFGIEDLSVECLVGANVDVSNIGPVLNYQDGVKSEFSINNMMADNMAIELRLDITDISDNLLTESLKYVLVTDTTGGTNYDYNNPIFEGDFSSFDKGNNLITRAMEVQSSITQNYQFIIYIDGNMYNDPNMQENSLIANLMIGNCGEDSVLMKDIVYQAIYSETDKSLTFTYNKMLKAGDIYNDKAVTAVYTGFDTSNYSSDTQVPWYSIRGAVTTVNFESKITPVSTSNWFNGFSKLTDIDIFKLDTSKVTNMSYMFRNCTLLTGVNLSGFYTSKVTDMKYMFRDCGSLIELDLSNFDTSNVTDMSYMFKNCSSLVNVDLSSFDTTKVKYIEEMFYNCSSIISLDLSNFNTSSIKSLYSVFRECSKLVELNISNWDISNVTLMKALFYGDKLLEKLDLSNFDTSNVTDMSYMFMGCSSLIKLDLSGFDTSNVTDMRHFFNGCSSLIELDLSDFDTSNVTDMRYLFNECNSLIKLDLSGFDTSNVTDMRYFFSGCNSLMELDVSNFDTSNLINMEFMFYNCRRLTMTITINNPNVSNYNRMFEGVATTKDSEGNYIGKITINYIPDNPNTIDINENTESLVDAMIATKNNYSNIEKGCFGDNCPIENT